MAERALYSNFSLFSLKPIVQFNLISKYFFGLLEFALSDEDGEIGLGFVSKYASEQLFGLCPCQYFSKSFITSPKKTKVNLSMDLTYFLAHGDAQNRLDLRINYQFTN